VSARRVTLQSALCAVLLCTPLLPLRAARAADATASTAPSDAAKARAQELLSQGIDAFRARRYKPAIDAFLAANELYPSAAISFNLARAYESLDDAASALRFYRDYLYRSPGAADAERIGQRVDQLEDVLRTRGVQQVTIRSTPAGATLLVDERAVGLTPWTGELVPGMHKLRLEHEGQVPRQETFELSPHRALELELTLTATPPPAPEVVAPSAPEPVLPPAPAPEPAPPAGGVGRVLPWIAFGAAGVALGGAAYFELQSAGAEEDARRARTQPEAADHIDSMHRAQTTARVLVAAGAALAVVGGVSFVLRGDRSEPAEASVALSCSGLGCDVWGRF